MKLRNKRTGEIIETDYELSIPVPDDEKFYGCNPYNQIKGYNSLAELNAEWEDAPEEPKEHWCITMYGGITRIKDDEEPIDDLIEIGNYLNSKEDAQDARDKLKAYKRLKDKGFRFNGWTIDDGLRISICTNMGSGGIYDDDKKEMKSCLDLLFSGEDGDV